MFTLVILDVDKSDIFEDMNNYFFCTNLVSKMVRDYDFLFGMYEGELSEFGDRVLFC